MGSNNNIEQIHRVNQIMKKYLRGITKGVSETTVDDWSNELKTSKKTMRSANSDLILLELE